ncbi:kanadaptin isoform X2 [Venturia canescens]|nr:kanadaptin isoform X2 [Venturia canescens]
MIRFGCSQRKFIIQTPPEDMEEESEYSVTELKEQRRLLMLEREQQAKEEQERAEEEERLRLEREENEGIDWGMGEDADEETDLTENPYASTNNEELFLDDPKKTLRGWFEREGHELQYETEEKGIGQFLCWVDLPIDGAGGRSVRAEAIVKGKKKESVIQCALEACRILDRHGVLRQATHEARKRKTRNWEEEDFYDSDEDNFLDRTGTVEKKREQRMRQAGKLEEKVETYASLVEKHTSIVKKIADIEGRIKKSQKSKEDIETSNEDALDAFMSSLNSNVYDKAGIRKMKLELQSLRKEEESLMKLVNITKPANLPTLTSQQCSDDLPNFTDENKSSKSSNKRFASSIKKSISKTEIDEVEPATRQSSKEVPGIANSTTCLVEEESKIVELPVTENPEREESRPLNDDGAVASTEVKEKSDAELAKKKMKNMKRMQQRAGKVVKEIQKGYGDETFDEDYSMWLPPQNQSGDGKTSLNDKYGY